MSKIAIIGAGIVGASAAYYLSQLNQHDVTIFDDGNGQATKAAAGIISPWFSKRRNKSWYFLARKGADFYLDLVNDLQKNTINTDFYHQTGVIVLKKDQDKLEELYQIALKRQIESPIIGDLRIIEPQELKTIIPLLNYHKPVLFASGGAKVDGALLTKTLIKASQFKLINEKVNISKTKSNQYVINGQIFDKVIIAAGAWTKELLEPLGFDVDIRPQKGQLSDFYLKEYSFDRYPVIMPEGEIDIIPFSDGRLTIGASHENEKGFNINIDQDILKRHKDEASYYVPDIANSENVQYRVGTRAYTSDFSPFFGEIEELPGVFVASGLGSTGLTIGPLIGKELSLMVCGQETSFSITDYDPKPYVKYGQK
ncbi:hypothetical protein HMPREF9318_00656 [Streptococcus urinalis FB127-CNA-2]|uniref:FAD dependent oxidoreductase n=1 Tax=Streptococcus urinalis 2285-97 TaxID=764291 RepID=G5KH18_9STRE|nr:FAD-binding oxidoreductase [Streptococcus urinalis]EHJ55949.1 FAD dependent oxidoreductase [Streptococcus urinalis 2285-97]EKS22458.1 hypothetical protein HMPREF9318_00656 [Streptococcus urinalis FB127-CNA-2]VEF32271.1 oxidoreductase, DadA family protein [Streptococcus urinalis]